MGAKTAIICGILIGVDIVRTRGSCFLKYIVDKIVQGLNKKEARAQAW